MTAMSEAAIVYVVLAALVILFVWNRFPVEFVALTGTLVLAATGVLSINDALGGFGDTTVIFIAALFVVSEGIDRTGVTAWAGQELIRHAGDSKGRLIVLMMGLVALLTAMISVNGAVAALIPMVVVVALRTGTAPSKLLMPLAFGAHAGSLLVLTGTPVHILVSDAAVDAGEAGFRFFEFGLVGVPVLIACVIFVLLFGERLLPNRKPESIPPDLSDQARVLMDQYRLGDWVARLELREDSPLVGSALGDVDVSGFGQVVLVGGQGSAGALGPDSILATSDVLIVRGEAEGIYEFSSAFSLERSARNFDSPDNLIDDRVGVVEVVIPPRSDVIGTKVFPGMVTSSGIYVILAVQRNGIDVDFEPTILAPGDTLLLQGTWDSLDRGVGTEGDVLIVDTPTTIRRQALPLGPRSTSAIVILVVMVFLLATGLVIPAVAALLAAGAMVLTNVVSLQDAYRSISWTTVVLVAAMIPVSQAVEDSGAADQIANLIIDIVGGYSPYIVLLALFLLTALFGQLISNMATALIVIPIGVTAAADLGISARPVLMCITVAAAGAFLTPVATPANLMVMSAAGYQFRDYWKLGLPLLIIFMAAAVFLVPVFWGF